MFNLAKFFFVSSSATLLSILPVAVATSAPVIVDLPTDSTSSCNATINEVTAELAEKGYFIPWQQSPQLPSIEPEIVVSDENISNNYYDYPSARLSTVTFKLSGDESKLYNELMASPVFMTTRSAKIMAACPQVGMVEFRHWWEGFVPIGYFADNTARPFEWVQVDWGLDNGGPHHRYAQTSRGRTLQLEWGYYNSL